MTQPMNPGIGASAAAREGGLRLKFPQPVATYTTYTDAQKAVDALADGGFPVENLAIVGTDLRQYERVLGQMNWGKVILNGAIMGVGNGLFVGLILALFNLVPFLMALLWGIVIGVLFGIAFNAISYAMTRGQRDFSSITQTFAMQYELVAEHKVAQQARDALAATPGERAAAMSGQPGAVQHPAPQAPAEQPTAPPAQPYGEQPPASYQEQNYRQGPQAYGPSGERPEA